MKFLTSLFVLMFLALPPADAQGKASALRFKTVENIGMAFGQHGNGVVLQTINGISGRGWFAGAGVGLDFYQFRTIPVFGHFGIDLSGKKSTPFVYADLGASAPWAEQQLNNFGTDNRYNLGRYYELGIGQSFAMEDRARCHLSLGYNYNEVRQTTNTGTAYEGKNRYQMRKWILKIGFSF